MITRPTTDPDLDPDRAVALQHLRGPEEHWQGIDRTVRRHLPLFAAVGALTILLGLLPFPHDRTTEVCVGVGLFCALSLASMVLPWSRLPQSLWPLIPVGFIAVVALIRDADGGSGSGLGMVFLLPIVWLAFYGRRSHLVVGLGAMTAALVVPMVLVGAPAYPISGWRIVVVTTVVATLISFTFLTLVNRDRAFVADMAEQALLVQRGARQAEEARERLDSLLRAATHTAVLGCDTTGTVTFFSAGAEHLLGYSAEDVVGKMSLFHFIEPDELDRRRPNVEQLATAGAHRTGSREDSIWTYVRQDGTRGRMSAAVTAQPASANLAGGGPSGYVVVATDVTEHEQLVAERERLLAVQREVTQVLVEQNQRLRELTQMKDDVVATVSHELRTPLTSIRGFVELLLDGDGTWFDEEQSHMLRTIDRNSLQLLRVADDLLADPGRGRGLRLQFVDTDLSVLACEAVDAMTRTAADQGIELGVETGEPVLVHGDPLRLHQLLGNLLSNAVKFTPPGGRVAVRVVSLGQFARLDVLDDGPGIPEAERAQLFDRFYRLASTAEQGIPGSGLGLAISKSVVEAHNGTIDIIDTAGWSTTFRVHLPAVDLQAGSHRLPGADGEPTSLTPRNTVRSEQ